MYVREVFGSLGFERWLLNIKQKKKTKNETEHTKVLLMRTGYSLPLYHSHTLYTKNILVFYVAVRFQAAPTCMRLVKKRKSLCVYTSDARSFNKSVSRLVSQAQTRR